MKDKAILFQCCLGFTAVASATSYTNKKFYKNFKFFKMILAGIRYWVVLAENLKM